MSRENQITEAASEFTGVAQQAASILAGDVIATQVFNAVDRSVLASNFQSNSMVRKGVNLVGPGALGALVFSMSNNEVAQGIAVGHGLTSVRRIVDEGLGVLGFGSGFVPDTDQNGGNGDGGGETSGFLPESTSVGQAQGQAQPQGAMAGRRLAEAGQNAASSATGSSGQMVVEGA